MTPYYDHAGITIYHGDCRQISAGLHVDLVLTDPPYNHKHVDGGGFASARKFYRDGALYGLQDFDVEEYEMPLLKTATMLVAFHSRDLIPDYAALARRELLNYDLHIWYKNNAIPFTSNTWKSDLEYIALLWSKKPGWIQMEQAMHSKAWISSINNDKSHPAGTLLRDCSEADGAGSVLVHLNFLAIVRTQIVRRQE